MSDISLLLPPHFTGSRDQDPVRWLQQFKRYAAFKNLKEEQILGTFPLLLRGYAFDWFDSLNEGTKEDLAELYEPMMIGMGLSCKKPLKKL